MTGRPEGLQAVTLTVGEFSVEAYVTEAQLAHLLTSDVFVAVGVGVEGGEPELTGEFRLVAPDELAYARAHFDQTASVADRARAAGFSVVE